MARIEARGITKRYPLADGSVREALRGVDLRVRSEEFLCLLGPSGCGKTTLLNILSGLDRDHEGSVRYVGEDGGAAAPVVSYMFQESRLLPWLTVEANLRFVLDVPRARKEGLVRQWLERVGLSANGDDYPSQLSVGMQQRVAVARALIVEPDILFMDEPFSALDELTAGRMRRELLELWEEHRPTVVFVTHNPLEAAFLADRVAVMTPGPGRIVGEIDLRDRLARPRDSDDVRLWEVSREVVRLLEGGPRPEANPAVSG